MNEDLLTTMEELLSCPVCLDVPDSKSQIFQCHVGHLVCQGCFSSLNWKCPICRGPLDSRNRNCTAEQMIPIFQKMTLEAKRQAETEKKARAAERNNNKKKNSPVSPQDSAQAKENHTKSNYRKNDNNDYRNNNRERELERRNGAISRRNYHGNNQRKDEPSGAQSLPSSDRSDSSDVSEGDERDDDKNVDVQKAIELSYNQAISDNSLEYAILLSESEYLNKQRLEREEIFQQLLEYVGDLSLNEK